MAEQTKIITQTTTRADEMKVTTQTSMPAQPVTISLPAMTDRALLEDLTRVVKTGFADVRVMRGDLDLLVGDVGSLKVDVRDLQRWKLDSDDRHTRHSGGLVRVSTSDAGQDAAIGLIKATVEETAAEVAALKSGQEKAAEERARTAALTVGISEALSGFWTRNPALEKALVGLLLILAAVAGAYLQARK